MDITIFYIIRPCRVCENNVSLWNHTCYACAKYKQKPQFVLDQAKARQELQLLVLEV